MKTMITIALLFCISLAEAEIQQKGKTFEIPVSDISVIAINHFQGGVALLIKDEHYIYNIDSESLSERVSLASIIAKDIRNADNIQIKYTPYGKNYRIENLLLFYGDRKIAPHLILE